jgi:hypothetical protein
LLAQGWTDAMRKLILSGRSDILDYKFERRRKDKCMRLDHFLLSPKLSDRQVDGGVDLVGGMGRKTRTTILQHGSCSIKLRWPLFLTLRRANPFRYLDL